MNFFRWMFGLPMAALVTAALFLAMAGLIKQDADIRDPGPDRNFTITAKLKLDEPTKIKPARPIAKEILPPTILKWPGTGKPPGPTPTVPGGKTIQTDPPKTGGMPVLKIPPAYPENCRARGAQGSVTVMYDITDRGEVVNVRVISSDNGCLEGAAKKAVSGWKYPPGRQTGLIQTFSFTLAD